VPDDRVPERVEPVIRELEALLAAGAPRRGAGVLEAEPRTPDDAGARLVELVGEPPHRERADRHGVLADAFHYVLRKGGIRSGADPARAKIPEGARFAVAGRPRIDDVIRRGADPARAKIPEGARFAVASHLRGDDGTR